MARIIVIDDTKCNKELNSFLLEHKDYIQLNSTIEELTTATRLNLTRFLMENESSNQALPASDNQIGLVRLGEIVRFTCTGKHTEIVQANNTVSSTSTSLVDIEQKLMGLSFLRIHEQHIINFDYLSACHTGDNPTVKLTTGETLPVDKDRLKHLMTFIESINNSFIH